MSGFREIFQQRMGKSSRTRSCIPLNLGPDADGVIPLEQEGIMNELSLWMENTEEGLKLDVMRAQRIYNDRLWPNPI